MKEKIKKLPMQNWYIKEKATLVEALFNKVNELVTAHNDTVLVEERKIGGHTYSKSGKDMCCQPLTEGEYGKPDFIGKDNLGALEQVHKDMSEGEGEDLEVKEEYPKYKETSEEEKEKHFKGDGCVGHFSDQVKQGEEPVQKLLPKKLNTEVYITDVLDRDLLNKVNEIIEYLKEK